MDGVSLVSACSPTRALLEVRDLSICYRAWDRATPIIQDLNFDLSAGEVVGIQGRSGCGKTSVALALLNLLPASARVRGSAFFRGRDLLKFHDSQLRKIRGNEISIMHQEPALALNPVMRVGDQISEILRAHTSLKPSSRRDRVREILDQVQLGSERYSRAYPHELSGGECHRVVLAQALICRPALVLADEPTANLDQLLKNEILDLIDRLRRETATAFLLISHDRSVTDRLANRTIHLSPQSEHKSTFTARRASADKEMVIPTSEAIPLVSVRNLSKRYKPRGVFSNPQAEKQALQSVDLSIAKGSLTALVGPSGSGKSTLARCIALLEAADTGEIRFEGRDLSQLEARELPAFRQRLQYIFQDAAAALNPRLSAEETIAEPLLIQKKYTREEQTKRVQTLMQQTGLDPAARQRSCHEFSGGQKQRLVIARALALEPSLLIFDESLSGLDPETRDEIFDLLLSLRRKLGITQLLISHDLEFVSRVADSIAIMRDGRLLKQQKIEDAACLISTESEVLPDLQSQSPCAFSEAK